MPDKRTKILIVDGYNVLRSGSRYRSMRHAPDYTFEKYNQVREALISDVAAFAGSEYRSVTVVFDGGDNPESAGKTQRIGVVKVVFSPYGSSADKVIEKLAHDAREKNFEVLVVTKPRPRVKRVRSARRPWRTALIVRSWKSSKRCAIGSRQPPMSDPPR